MTQHFQAGCASPGPLSAGLDEQLRYNHQMNIEAHRDRLRMRGFPPGHPLVRGEISIHPELVGHLHFGRPGQTSLPLSHDDFVRFLPEMQRSGMQSSFPGPEAVISHNLSIPKHEKRSRSSDPRPRPRSMFPTYRAPDQVMEDRRPWYMREPRDLPGLRGLPSQSRTDSGIGDELWRSSRGAATPTSSSFGMILKDKFQKNPNMYFPDLGPAPAQELPPQLRMRSSKKEEEEDWSDADTLVHNMSEGSFDKVNH